MSIKERMDRLYTLISRHADLYYNQDAPEISDTEYDSLVRELKQLEAEYPDLVRKDTVIHTVGGLASDLFSKVKHTVPMLSLDNVFDTEELKAFFSRIKVASTNEAASGFMCELKSCFDS